MKRSSMNKKIASIITAWAIAMIGMIAYAQNDTVAEDGPLPISGIDKTEAIQTITSNYTDWQSVSMSGKLSSSMLPMSATMKVYMEKDSLVVITLSAFIFGEVARVEIDNNQVIAVYKMGMKYSTFSMEEIENIYPGGLATIQSLILGRVELPGYGQLSAANAAHVEIYDVEDEVWAVIPEQNLDSAPLVCLYNVDAASGLLDSFVGLTQDGEEVMESNFYWKNEGYKADITVSMGNRAMDATVQLSPDKTPKKISRAQLSKYQHVSPSQLMKGLK